MDPFELFADLLLVPVPVAIADEETAIELVIAHRWPHGVRCPQCGSAAVARQGPTFECAFDHRERRFTIFVGTPLASLIAPRARMILLALRALVLDKRGIAARPLAAMLGIPHVTVWRHLHRLRELLPTVPGPTSSTTSVQVCGRKDEDRAAHVLAAASADAPNATFAADVAPADADEAAHRWRLAGEGVRTWLSGTFHGVSPRYLPSYVHEALVRLRCTARATVLHVLRRVLAIRG